MQRKLLIYLPLLIVSAAVPVAGAAAFADALVPSLVASAGPPDQGSSLPGGRDEAQDELPATANSPTAPAMPNDPSYHGQPYVGALTAPPAAAMNKTYPTCTATTQDNCRNSDGH